MSINVIILPEPLVPSIIESVIKSPAIQALRKQTIEPARNALRATLVMDFLRSGANALSAPIMIPRELGFANPQMAYVAIAAERS